jgi:predicted MFS family arabinose efflux permease
MKPGSWASIICIYLFGVCGGSTVSKLIPLAGDVGQTFGLFGADFGWLVALVALPAALFAIPSGVVVDNLGSKRVLLGVAMLGVAANGVYLVAESLPLIYAARIMEGLATVHIYTAAPAFLMATVAAELRTKAMTFWSTYAPVGTAVGLGLGGIFAETAGWRMTFAGHGALFATAGMLALLQPNIAIPKQAKKTFSERIAELFIAFRRPQLVSLGVAFMLIISLGMGANLTLPLLIAEVHVMPAGSASNMVASVTLVMILGSALAGILLARKVNPVRMFVMLALAGFAAGSLSFYPELSVQQRYGVMFAWFLVSGAGLATTMATLPLTADPARPGSAAALLNFAGAVAALVNPPIWLGIFQSGQWLPFLGMMAAGWAIAVLMVCLVFRLAAAHTLATRDIKAS